MKYGIGFSHEEVLTKCKKVSVTEQPNPNDVQSSGGRFRKLGSAVIKTANLLSSSSEATGNKAHNNGKNNSKSNGKNYIDHVQNVQNVLKEISLFEGFEGNVD